jgi:hypothetical protein
MQPVGCRVRTSLPPRLKDGEELSAAVENADLRPDTPCTPPARSRSGASARVKIFKRTDRICRKSDPLAFSQNPIYRRRPAGSLPMTGRICAFPQFSATLALWLRPRQGCRQPNLSN